MAWIQDHRSLTADLAEYGPENFNDELTMEWFIHYNSEKIFGFTILTRQFTIPHGGRVDMLGQSEDAVYLIELKCSPYKTRHRLQVNRYIRKFIKFYNPRLEVYGILINYDRMTQFLSAKLINGVSKPRPRLLQPSQNN